MSPRRHRCARGIALQIIVQRDTELVLALRRWKDQLNIFEAYEFVVVGIPKHTAVVDTERTT